MLHAIAALALLACSTAFATEPTPAPVEQVTAEGSASADRLPAGTWCGFKMHGIPGSRHNCGGFDPETTCPKNFIRISIGVNDGTLGTSEGSGTLYVCVRT